MELLSPKESGIFISKNAQNVTINSDGIERLSEEVMKQLSLNNIKINCICEHETYPQNVSDEQAVDWLFVLDSINYCFWTPGPGKWEILWKGKTYTGWFGLCAAVIRAIEEGIDLTNPKVYSKLTLDEVRKIFRSSSGKEIPQIEERLRCLQQVGTVLLEKFEGSFVNCVKASNESAQKLLHLITTEFECYNDIATYKNKKVSFHKRAQIVVADLWSQFAGQGYGKFNDIETLTMFADYRVPQVLVYFGAMSYSNELLEKLKSCQLLEPGCEEEVEIRGCSIEVVERVKERVDKLMEEKGKKYLCNSTLIDNFLWLYRRKNDDKLGNIPFHRVVSIFY